MALPEDINNEEDDNDFFDYATDVLAAPFRGLEGAVQGAYNLADYLAFDILPDYDTRFLGTSKTMAGGAVEGISQFATGFIPLFGLAGKAGRLAKAGKATQAVVAGAATDFTFFNGQEARLSNLIQQVPELQNPVTEFLAYDGDESELEGRMKNVLEGLGLEAVAGSFIAGLKAIKNGRRVKQNEGTPEEVANAMVEPLQGGRIIVDDQDKLTRAQDQKELDELFTEVGGDPEDVPVVDLSKINWDEVDLGETSQTAPRISREEAETVTAGGRMIDEVIKGNAIVRTFELPNGSKRTLMLDRENPERIFAANQQLLSKLPEYTGDVPVNQFMYNEHDIKTYYINTRRILEGVDFEGNVKAEVPLVEMLQAVIKDTDNLIKEGRLLNNGNRITHKVDEDTNKLVKALLNLVVDDQVARKAKFRSQAHPDAVIKGREGVSGQYYIEDRPDRPYPVVETRPLGYDPFGPTVGAQVPEVDVPFFPNRDLYGQGDEVTLRTAQQIEEYKRNIPELPYRLPQVVRTLIHESWHALTQSALSSLTRSGRSTLGFKGLEYVREATRSADGFVTTLDPKQLKKILDEGLLRKDFASKRQHTAAKNLKALEYLAATKRQGFIENVRKTMGQGAADKVAQDIAYAFETLTNPEAVEFITEAGSNLQFMKFLQSIKINEEDLKFLKEAGYVGTLPRDQSFTLFQVFINAIKYALGLKKGDLDGTLLERTLFNIDDLREPSKRWKQYETELKVRKDISARREKFEDLEGRMRVRSLAGQRRFIERQKAQGLFSKEAARGFAADIDPKTKEFLLKGAESRKLKEKGFKETRTEAGVVRERIKPEDLDEIPTVSNTLDQLAANAENSAVRNLAKSLKGIIKDPEDLNVPIEYDPKAGKPRTTLEGQTQTLGSYDPFDDKINLNQAATEETIVHEILHGVTTRKLAGFVGKGKEALRSVTLEKTGALLDNPKTPKAVKELAESFRKAAVAGMTSGAETYPMQNLDEFLVGAFTNKDFQKLLSRIPAEDNRNLFQKIVDAVADLIGIKGKGTLLEKVIRDGAEVISSSRREAVSPEFTRGLKEFGFESENLRFSEKAPDEFIESVPEKFRGFAEALVREGVTPRLPQFALETGEDVVVLKDILEQYYKENPDKITVSDAVSEVDEEIEKTVRKQAKEGEDAEKVLRDVRITQQAYREQGKSIIQNISEIAKEAEDNGYGSVSVTKLKNAFQQLIVAADVYRRIGRETAITLRARRENFSRNKIGLSETESQIEGLRNEFVNNSGGVSPQKMVKWVQEHIDPDDLDASLDKMFKTAKKAQGKSLLDMPTEYWMNSILSGPKTQIVNIMGNALTQVMTTLEAVAGGIASGNMDVVKSVIASWSDGEMFKEAFKFAKKAFKEQDNLLDPSNRAFEEGQRRAITGERLGGMASDSAKQSIDALGNIIRIPSRLLLTSDEFFKQLAYRRAARMKAAMSGLQQGIRDPKALSEHIVKTMDGIVTEGGRMMSEEGLVREASAIADKQGLKGKDKAAFVIDYKDKNFNPDASALMNYALDEAQYLTFTKELQDRTLGKVLQEATNKLPFLRLIVPFVRTPTNILKFAAERTPFAVLLREERQRFAADFRSGDPTRIARANGKMIVGALNAGIMIDVAYNNRDFITGGGPTNEREKEALLATGWRPYSIKIGDTYFSYQRLDPIATILGISADIVETIHKEGADFDESEAEHAAQGLVLSLTRNFTNKSYLAGIQLWADALGDPDRYVEKLGRNYAASFVPNVLSQMADYDTQAVKEARSITDAMKKKLGLRGSLDTKRNILGEEYKAEQWMGTGFINPIQMSTKKDDPILNEMASLNHAFRNPEPNLGGQIDLREYESEQGQSAYDRQLELLKSVKLRGLTLRQTLNKLIKSRNYQRLSPESEPGLPSPRIQQINSILTRFRKEARRQMLREYPELDRLYSNLTRAKAQFRGGMQREDVLELLQQTN